MKVLPHFLLILLIWLELENVYVQLCQIILILTLTQKIWWILRTNSKNQFQTQNNINMYCWSRYKTLLQSKTQIVILTAGYRHPSWRCWLYFDESSKGLLLSILCQDPGNSDSSFGKYKFTRLFNSSFNFCLFVKSMHMITIKPSTPTPLNLCFWIRPNQLHPVSIYLQWHNEMVMYILFFKSS